MVAIKRGVDSAGPYLYRKKKKKKKKKGGGWVWGERERERGILEKKMFGGNRYVFRFVLGIQYKISTKAIFLISCLFFLFPLFSLLPPTFLANE